MHRGRTCLLCFLAALVLPAPSAADEPTLPRADLSADEGETLASIDAMPMVIGDRETQRRQWIRKAWMTKKDQTKTPMQRDADSYAYMRAADHVRSSTFTRCNLGLLAHHLKHLVEAAEYFQSELDLALAPTASERVKEIRHLCEVYAHLAFERVGALRIIAPDDGEVWINTELVGHAPLLGSIYVKPNQDLSVRVKLRDEGDLRETVLVREGKSTTLEFSLPKKPKKPPTPKPDDTPKTQPSSAQPWMTAPPPFPREDPTLKWRYATGGASAVLGVASLLFLGLSVWKYSAVDTAWETTTTATGEKCNNAPDAKECRPILGGHDVASAWGYAALGLGISAGAGAAFTIYLGLPDSPSPTPKMGASSPKPSDVGLRIQGRF